MGVKRPKLVLAGIIVGIVVVFTLYYWLMFR